MDFTGSTGRAIRDPLDVAVTSIGKKPSWRKKFRTRASNAGKILTYKKFSKQAVSSFYWKTLVYLIKK